MATKAVAKTVAQNQSQFAEDIARATGLDPRVVYAWAQSEGAYAKGGTGGFNFLNLRPYSGDKYASVSPGGFEQFSSLADAEKATLRRISMPFASPIAKAGQAAKFGAALSPAQEIGAIASTGWDSGHYGGPGGPALQRIFASIFPNQLGTAIANNAGSFGGQDVAGGVNRGAKHIPGVSQAEAAAKNAGAVAAAIGWLFNGAHITRVGEVLAGSVLVAIGLVILGKGATSMGPAKTVSSAAGTVARVRA